MAPAEVGTVEHPGPLTARSIDEIALADDSPRRHQPHLAAATGAFRHLAGERLCRLQNLTPHRQHRRGTAGKYHQQDRPGNNLQMLHLRTALS